VQPLVLVFEDLHWCDASSLEVLGRVVAQSATARVLLLMTARPELAPPWPSRENTTVLSLARLTRRQARDMIAALQGGALPPETLDALVDRAGGVPLFVEELTKSLVQPGAGHGIEAIPATLADSLMARLDRLPSAREVAQRAAVLGRELDYRLLAAISGIEETLLRQSLDRLVEAEILFVRGEPPDATYTFKHALVQEAARESLLKSTRQQLHGRVVDVLVERFPARAEAEPERVARHAEAAGRVADAIVFYRRAGDLAQARSAHEEAIRHFEQAVELIAARPRSRERDGLEASIQLTLAESRAVALGYTSPAVQAAQERARQLCEATGDTLRLGFALSGLAVFAYNSGRAADAGGLAARALEIAEETADADLRLRAHCALGLIECYRGRFASSLAQLEGAIALHRAGARPAGPSATGDPGVRALSASAWVIFALGFPDRALARAREAVARAHEIAHPFNVAHALLFETVAHTLRRDVAAQREGAARVIALAETHAFPFWKGVGLTFLGAARVAEGDPAGIEDVRAGLAMTAATGSRGGAPLMLAQLAEATLAAGLLGDARGAARAGLALSAETDQHFYDSAFHWLEARILLAAGGDADEAEWLLRRAVSIARDQQARSFELRAATSLARLLCDRRRPDEARALLAPSYAWFTEGFDTADLVAARSLLASLA
jgi:tetratricopeptide (TPR) repeat protein